MKYLKKFETTIEYEVAYPTLDQPNVSLIETTDEVKYLPYVVPEGSGSEEPVLEGNKILCKYNVEDTSSSIDLYYYEELISGSGSGSGSDSVEFVSMFSSMEVDGIEQEVTRFYTFDTTGEHTVLFTLVEGITYIHENLFDGCSELTSVIIGNSVTSIDERAFEGCSGLTSVIIGNSVTSISNNAFQGCSGLTSITIPNSVISIDNYAFANCSGLTSITIPNSVISIGDNAFSDCSELISVTIGNSVASISGNAFSGCSGLTSIIVAANNQTYDSRNNCNAIIETSINELIVGCKNTIIPDSVTSLGYGAFSGCSGLTNITIPNLVTSIGISAFAYCSGLTSIIIPNSVISIDNYAFQGCSGLISVTIGNSVTLIDYGAFTNCSGLTSITCNAMTAPTISYTTFNSVKTGGTLTVPAGSTGYDVWMGTDAHYLGYYNWTKVEQ